MLMAHREQLSSAEVPRLLALSSELRSPDSLPHNRGGPTRRKPTEGDFRVKVSPRRDPRPQLVSPGRTPRAGPRRQWAAMGADILEPMSLKSPGLPLAVLSTLVDLGTELQAEEVDLPRVLELATGNAARLLGTDIAWLALFDDETRTMHVAVSYGATGPEFAKMRVSENEGLGGAALKARGPVVVADYSSWAAPGPVRDAMLAEGVCSVVCAPMLRGDRVVGVLYAATACRRSSPRLIPRSSPRLRPRLQSQSAMVCCTARCSTRPARWRRPSRSTVRSAKPRFPTWASTWSCGRSARSPDGVYSLNSRSSRRSRYSARRTTTEVRTRGDAAVASVVSVRRNESAVGHITVYGQAPLSELEQNALSHGATVLALELMKHEAAQHVEWRLRGDLLEQLLEAEDDRSDELAARARRFGIDLTEACSIVVVEGP